MATSMIGTSTHCIYMDSIARTYWGPRRLDAWLLWAIRELLSLLTCVMPKTSVTRTSDSYNLFPQHCIISVFTDKQCATAVNSKLREASIVLDKKAKKRLLKSMANLIEIMMAKKNTPPQRVDEPPTSEGVLQEQRVGSAPLVTTRTSLTVPVVIQTTAQPHKRTTIHNTP